MISAAVIFFLALPFLAPALRAQTPLRQSSTEYQVKAAYLYNFARFVAWPQDHEGEIRICLLGDDPFGADLDALGEHTAQSRPLTLVRPVERDRIGACHMLFIADSEVAELASILATLGSSSVLTVGESEGFAAAGGIIGFIDRGGRVGLEINLEAARAASLDVSSKLLEVARIVRSTDPGGSTP